MVLFGPFCTISYYLVHFGLIQSISVHSVLFDLIWSTFVHFVYFRQLWSFWITSVQSSPFWSSLVHSMHSVHFCASMHLVHSVYFGPFYAFDPFWSTSSLSQTYYLASKFSLIALKFPIFRLWLWWWVWNLYCHYGFRIWSIILAKWAPSLPKSWPRRCNNDSKFESTNLGSTTKKAILTELQHPHKP